MEENVFEFNNAAWGGVVDFEIFAGRMFFTSNIFFKNSALSKDGVASGSVIKFTSSLISNALFISRNSSFIQNYGLMRGIKSKI